MSEEGKQRSHLFFRWLFGLALLAALIYVVTHLEEGRDFLRQLLEADFAPLLPAVGLQLLTYVVDAAVWAICLARMGEGRSLWRLTRYSLAKFFVDQFLPTGGVTGTVLVMRSLERTGTTRHATTAALIVRLVTYYASYALALSTGLLLAWLRADLPRWVLIAGTALTAIFLAIAVGIFFVLRRPFSALPGWLRRRKVVRAAEPTLLAIGASAPEVLRDGRLLLDSTLLQLAIFFLDAATLWLCFKSVGMPSSFDAVYAAYLLSLAVGSVGLLPGAIGTFEAGAVVAFGLMGIPVASALAAVLLFRGLSLWIPLLPGFVEARRESWR